MAKDATVCAQCNGTGRVDPPFEVGDKIKLGNYLYSAGMVVRVFWHGSCGWRIDVERPYQLWNGEKATVGVESVTFLDPAKYKKEGC